MIFIFRQQSQQQPNGKKWMRIKHRDKETPTFDWQVRVDKILHEIYKFVLLVILHPIKQKVHA